MSVWVAVLGVGAGSYALRAIPLLVLGQVQLSRRSEEAIGRAGLAALTALIALSTRSVARGAATPAALAAVAVGLVLAHRRASMLQIMAAGGAMYAAGRLTVAALG